MTDDQSRQAEFLEQLARLNYSDSISIAQVLEIAAESLENLHKSARAVSFLRVLSLSMYERSIAVAEAEGLPKQRSEAEVAAILAQQKGGQLLN